MSMSLWSDVSWSGVLWASLAGILLGRYVWLVACRYSAFLNADLTGAAPDARLLGRALRDGLRWMWACSRTDYTRRWQVGIPMAVLIMAYALLSVQASTPLSALGLGWAVTLLILLALIDARTGLLPDALTLPLLWTGLAWALLDAGLVSVHTALTAAMVAYVVLWLLAWGFLRLRGRDGMGGGDVKLLAAIGAWVGWPDVFLVLLGASVTGLIYALLIARKARLDAQHPFGPHLAGVTMVLLLLRVPGLGG